MTSYLPKLTDKSTLADYISYISQLPQLIIRKSGILPEDLTEGAQGQIFFGCNLAASIKEKWLRHELLKQHELLPMLESNTLCQSVKPNAIASVARYNLAKAVYERVGFLLKDLFLSHEHWWFECEWECCGLMMQQVGLTGEALLMGKHRLADEVLNGLQDLENPKQWVHDWLKDLGVPKQLLHDWLSDELLEWLQDLAASQQFVNNGGQIEDEKDLLSPFSTLIDFGVALAYDDRSFKNIWLKYVQSEQECVRTIRTSSLNLSFAYLMPDDTLRVMRRGNGKRGLGKKKSKRTC